ncbi:MAG: GntR family transcriptional regulator, partial [Clostridium sp.]
MKRKNCLPLYLQVVRYVQQKISEGEIGAGEKLPSRRDVAKMFNINLNTAQRAYTILENEGLIITINNSRSHITTDLLTLQKVRKN